MNARLESALQLDRWIVLGALAGVTAVAWGHMVQEAREMSLSGVCHCAGMKMSAPDLSPWSASVLIPLFLMWSEMMVAMMLPSAAPMILAFAVVNRRRREQELPYVSTGAFVLGYLAVWTGFSALAAVAQWALHGAALLSPLMASRSSLLAGTLLTAAGIFQCTPLKHACLKHCRTPLNFLLHDWRDGRGGALIMGLRHGLYCTGCCALLMGLLFVAGVMNLWWVGLIALFVLVEKVAPRSWLFSNVAGGILLIWGLVLIIR